MMAMRSISNFSDARKVPSFIDSDSPEILAARKASKKITVCADPILSPPLTGGKIVQRVTLADIPDVESLRAFLNNNGLDTSDWGKGNTKGVEKFWAEIDGDESGLEIWRKADGVLQPVRTTHVLRAKVCSPDSFKRGVFLMNTWQQYGDGRKRVRNGLLSEKLTISEMPLEDNLAEVCRRAVTEEEMQRVADPLLKIGPKQPAPTYDPSYVCPLNVVDQYFEDHVVELENSKSYPRLLTMYHLYTVSILCTGLPSVDFNTLEFDHEDAKGQRKLKYVHAWVWMKWSEIQRYLFEGSTLKERKGKDSFDTTASLLSWLQHFSLDLHMWGIGRYDSVDSLWHELQKNESHLELWGRNDGAPLLMRVVHVLQLQVSSVDPRLKGKFLYHISTERSNGFMRPIGRLMARTLGTAKILDQAVFVEAATKMIKSQLTYVVETHSPFPQNQNVDDLQASDIHVVKLEFINHRVDVEESPTFKGLYTLYHCYMCEVVCTGLPLANFGSLELSTEKQEGDRIVNVEPYVKFLLGWCWCTWPQTLDMLHHRTKVLNDKSAGQDQLSSAQGKCAERSMGVTDKLIESMQKLVSNHATPKSMRAEAEVALADARKQQKELRNTQSGITQKQQDTGDLDQKMQIPPAMLSEMEQENKLLAEGLDHYPAPDLGLFHPVPMPPMPEIVTETIPRKGEDIRGWCFWQSS